MYLSVWVDSFSGQVKVLRAMMYHQLARTYQKAYCLNPNAPGVPLILLPPTENYTPESEGKGRGTLTQVYEQMVKDLKDAIGELSSSRANKGYINQQVANGLLARVLCDMAYVGTDNGFKNNLWDEVITHAQAACAGLDIMDRELWSLGFNDQSNEDWIWAFVNDSQGNTGYPSFFSFVDRRSGRNGYQNVRVDKAFIDMFDEKDIRKRFLQEPGSKPEDNEFCPGKFMDNSNLTGHIPMMRVSEMKLMEAEAYANKGELQLAQQKLDELRAKRIGC